MVNLLSLTVILPLLGAGGILLLSNLLSKVESKRDYLRVLVGLFPIVIVVLASVIVLTGGAAGRISLSSLYPSLLAESAVELRWNSNLWPLGLGLSVGSGCLLLAAGARWERSDRLVPVVLGLLGAGLASLWSGNPLTTIVCWALYDLLLALGWMAVGGDRREALRALIAGLCAGLLLWVGVVTTGGGIGSVAWALLPPGGPKMMLWLVAGLVRIGAYPLHVWVPREIESSSPANAVLLLSPLLGWGLWIRLASVGDGNLPVAAWMIAPALLTLLGGSILAWTENRAEMSRRWIAMAGNGVVLLAAVLAHLRGTEVGAPAPALPSGMTFGALGWTLSTTLLFLAGGIDLRKGVDQGYLPWAVPSLLLVLSLLGVPLTAGFVGTSSAVAEAAGTGANVLLVGVFMAYVLLSASVVRWLLGADRIDAGEGGVFGRVAYGTGLGGMTVALILCGLLPVRLFSGRWFSTGLTLPALLSGPSLGGWVMWVGAVLLGGAVGWLDPRFRPRLSLWLDAIHDVVQLEWAYALVGGAMEQGLGLVRVVDAVLGGRAAMLWSLVFLLVIVLAVGR